MTRNVPRLTGTVLFKYFSPYSNEHLWSYINGCGLRVRMHRRLYTPTHADYLPRARWDLPARIFDHEYSITFHIWTHLSICGTTWMVVLALRIIHHPTCSQHAFLDLSRVPPSTLRCPPATHHLLWTKYSVKLTHRRKNKSHFSNDYIVVAFGVHSALLWNKICMFNSTVIQPEVWM